MCYRVYREVINAEEYVEGVIDRESTRILDPHSALSPSDINLYYVRCSTAELYTRDTLAMLELKYKSRAGQ